MAFNAFKENYTGAIDVVTLGKGDGAVPVGGETCFPFYLFEGQMPHKPRMALEVWDIRPDDWPEAVLAPFAEHRYPAKISFCYSGFQVMRQLS